MLQLQFIFSAMSTQQDLTTNITDTDATSSETNFEIKWGVVLLYAVLIFIVVFGNIVVVISVIRFHFLHTVINMFVAGVASLDLLMGLTVIVEMGEHISPNWLKGRLSCVLVQAIGCTNAVASALLLFGTYNGFVGSHLICWVGYFNSVWQLLPTISVQHNKFFWFLYKTIMVCVTAWQRLRINFKTYSYESVLNHIENT